MANPTYTLYKRVQLSAGKWRYRKAAFHSNGKIKPHYVIVGGEEEKHEGDYFLAHDGKWIPVGDDPLEAQRKRAEYLTRVNYKRLHSESTVLPFAARQSEKKSIQVEVDAYLADLELAQRPRKSVNDKRKFLTAFMQIVGNSFVDEHDRNDVLKFRKARLLNYEPKSVHTQMMAVVTFFNKRLKVKLGMEAGDWPEYSPNDPEPYSRGEIVALEAHTQGKSNLLVRLFRSTGCRKVGREGCCASVRASPQHSDPKGSREYACQAGVLAAAVLLASVPGPIYRTQISERSALRRFGKP